ncbi:MAG: AAA family ATPase, partial [Okeania sp. SIO2D1]|nr:AAA family ATPase [Okeania sp. SIO2D1]
MLYLKSGCWASSVSLWSDRKTEKRLDLGGWCIVSAAPLQEAAERPNQRWLGIPRCLVEQRREDVKTRLIILIGLPASGKSTLARKIVTRYPQCQLISTDAIRAQLFGDEAIQGPWLQVWQQVQQKFYQAVRQTSLAIYDATNVQRRQRRQVIDLAKESGFT